MTRPDRTTLSLVLFLLALASLPGQAQEPPHDPAQTLRAAKRIVFLGDSITYAGQYIEDVETVLRIKEPGLRAELLNLGLPSETVSGLSEPGHANGEFPRPALGERLDRVLSRTKPDLIVACYGMNDGIYHPFDAERFAKFQNGMRSLHQKAEAIGARIIHLTPPVFDSEPIKAGTLPAGAESYPQPYEGYDDVLARYAEWLLSQRAEGWEVVDLHGPLKAALVAGRARDPNFRFANDGVHLNSQGHGLIARELLRYWGVVPRDGQQAVEIASLPHGEDVRALVKREQGMLKDAWLTATGHKRPGMTKGLPLDEANQIVTPIRAEIQRLTNP
jgi:lysophospholipase L1-like esterase